MDRVDPRPFAVRRAERIWRGLFILYALAMTTGTHWPALALGTSAGPDKLIHVLAFAMLGFLLLQSGWIRRLGVAAGVLVVWAAIDELSQGIPGLRRDPSWHDLVANLCGVSMVIVVASALRPVGGPANVARLAVSSLATRYVFARFRNLALMTLGGLLGVVLIGPLVVWAGLIAGLGSADGVLLALAVGGLAGGHGAFTALHRRILRVFAEARPCHACGNGPATPVCERCDATQWAGQWRGETGLSRGAHLRLLASPAGRSAIIGVAIMIVAFAFVVLRTRSGIVTTVNRLYYGMPAGLRLGIDLALLALLIAWAVDGYRRAVAKRVEKQDEACLNCGHDLRATPAPDDTGRCGECGAIFFAIPKKPPA